MRGFSRNLPLFSGKSGDYSKTRVASHTFREGTFTLVLL
jgi:hypothetical protein